MQRSHCYTDRLHRRLNSTTVPNIIWTLLEVLRRPELAQGLASEINHYSPSQGATYNVHAVISSPIVQSIFSETVRLRMASIVTHTTKERLQLDDFWVAPKDTRILIFPHHLSLSTAAWTRARSGSVEKPLDEYWPERFLVTNRTGSEARQIQRKHAAAPSFSMNGLEILNINMGSNVHPFLGSQCSQAIHAATLAVLFSNFEPQLCDPRLFDEVVPLPRDIAFGMLKPLDKIALRIRKRSGL